MHFSQVWLQHRYSDLLSYITVPRNSLYLDVGGLAVEISGVRVIIMLYLINDKFPVVVILLLNSYPTFTFY